MTRSDKQREATPSASSSESPPSETTKASQQWGRVKHELDSIIADAFNEGLATVLQRLRVLSADLSNQQGCGGSGSGGGGNFEDEKLADARVVEEVVVVRMDRGLAEAATHTLTSGNPEVRTAVRQAICRGLDGEEAEEYLGPTPDYPTPPQREAKALTQSSPVPSPDTQQGRSQRRVQLLEDILRGIVAALEKGGAGSDWALRKARAVVETAQPDQGGTGG